MIALNRPLKFIDFYSYRNYGFLLSIFFTIATVWGYLVLGFNVGIDFKAGFIAEITPSNKNIANDISKTLLEKNKDLIIQTSGKNIILRLQSSNNIQDSKAISFLKESILKIDKNVQFLKIYYVGPKITKDLLNKAIFSFFWAILVVMFYIFLRFNWKFSVAAILSLLHDLVVSIGFFIFTGYEFNFTSIAAILTIIGYSVNDSVVIFDRIREKSTNNQIYLSVKIINKSLNETLSRTIMTFLTTFAACVALCILGGEALKSFSAVITFGVAFGTYSSIFVSANLLPYLNK